MINNLTITGAITNPPLYAMNASSVPTLYNCTFNTSSSPYNFYGSTTSDTNSPITMSNMSGLARCSIVSNTVKADLSANTSNNSANFSSVTFNTSKSFTNITITSIFSPSINLSTTTNTTKTKIGLGIFNTSTTNLSAITKFFAVSSNNDITKINCTKTYNSWSQVPNAIPTTLNNDNITNVATNGSNVWIAASTSNSYLYSTNGISFIEKFLPLAFAVKKVCYVNSKFVILGDSNNILVSSDGITWTVNSMPSGSYNNIVYLNGTYVILTSGYTVYTSSNLTSWAGPYACANTVDNNCTMAATSSLIIVQNYSGTVFTSTNGINWSSGTTISNCQEFITYVSSASNKFYFTGKAVDYATYPGNNLFVSTDGLTWLPVLSNIPYDGFYNPSISSVVYSDGLYMLEANGSALCFSDDGITWGSTSTSVNSNMVPGLSTLFSIGNKKFGLISRETSLVLNTMTYNGALIYLENILPALNYVPSSIQNANQDIISSAGTTSITTFDRFVIVDGLVNGISSVTVPSSTQFRFGMEHLYSNDIVYGFKSILAGDLGNVIIGTDVNASATSFNYVNSEIISNIKPSVDWTPAYTFDILPNSTVNSLKLTNVNSNLINVGSKLTVDVSGNLSSVVVNSLTTSSIVSDSVIYRLFGKDTTPPLYAMTDTNVTLVNAKINNSQYDFNITGNVTAAPLYAMVPDNISAMNNTTFVYSNLGNFSMSGIDNAGTNYALDKATIVSTNNASLGVIDTAYSITGYTGDSNAIYPMNAANANTLTNCVIGSGYISLNYSGNIDSTTEESNRTTSNISITSNNFSLVNANIVNNTIVTTSSNSSIITKPYTTNVTNVSTTYDIIPANYYDVNPASTSSTAFSFYTMNNTDIVSNSTNMLINNGSTSTQSTITFTSSLSSLITSSWTPTFATANGVLFTMDYNTGYLCYSKDAGTTWNISAMKPGIGIYPGEIPNIIYFKGNYYCCTNILLSNMPSSSSSYGIYMSSDLINWRLIFNYTGTVCLIATDGNVLSVLFTIYSNFSSYVFYSTDGINFLSGTGPAYALCVGIAYNNGKFYAFSPGSILESSNGINWVMSSNAAAPFSYITSVYYTGTQYIVAGRNTSVANKSGIYSVNTYDGTPVQILNTNSTTISQSLYFNGVNYIATNSGSNIMYVTNNLSSFGSPITITGATFSTENNTACILNNNLYICGTAQQMWVSQQATPSTFVVTDLVATTPRYLNTVTAVSSPLNTTIKPIYIAKGGSILQVSNSYDSTAPNFLNLTYSGISNTCNFNASTKAFSIIYMNGSASYGIPTGLYLQFKIIGLNTGDILTKINNLSSATLPYVVSSSGTLQNTITTNNYIAKSNVSSITPSFSVSTKGYTVDSTSTIGNLILKNNVNFNLSNGDNFVYESAGVLKQTGNVTLYTTNTSNSLLNNTTVGSNPWGVISFIIGTTTYLGVSNNSSNTYVIYTVTGSGTLTQLVSLAVTSCNQSQFFASNGKYYIVVNSNTGAGSIVLLKFDGTTFAVFKTISVPSVAPANLNGSTLFTSNNQVRLVTCNDNNTNSGVVTWVWDIAYETFVQRGSVTSTTYRMPQGCCTFNYNGNIYLLVCYLSSTAPGVILYYINPSPSVGPVQIQVVSTTLWNGPCSYIIDGNAYVTTVNSNSTGVFNTYKFNGSQLVLIQTVSTLSTPRFANYYTKDSDKFLDITCFGNNTIETYVWNNNQWVFLVSTSTGTNPHGTSQYYIGTDLFTSVCNYGANTLYTFKRLPATCTITSPNLDVAIPTFVTKSNYILSYNNSSVYNTAIGNYYSSGNFTITRSNNVLTYVANTINVSNLNNTINFKLINLTYDLVKPDFVKSINSIITTNPYSVISNSANGGATTLDYITSFNSTAITPLFKFTPSTIYTVDSSSTIGNLKLKSNSANAINTGDKLIVDTGTNVNEIAINSVTSVGNSLFSSADTSLACNTIANYPLNPAANLPANTLYVSSYNKIYAKVGNTYQYVSTVPGNTVNNISGITYFKGYFYLSLIYASNQSTIYVYRSTDMINWVTVPALSVSNAGTVGCATDGNVLSTVYGGGVTEAGKTTILYNITTNDGITFTNNNINIVSSIVHILNYTYMNGLFISAAWGIAFSFIDPTNTNTGIIRDVNTFAGNSAIINITYQNNIHYISVQSSIPTNSGVWYSNNFIAGNSPIFTQAISANVKDLNVYLVYYNNLFYSTINGTLKVSISTDGISWSAYNNYTPSITAPFMASSCIFNNQLYYIGDNQTLYTITNDINMFSATDLKTIISNYTYTITSPSLAVAVPTFVSKGGQRIALSVASVDNLRSSSYSLTNSVNFNTVLSLATAALINMNYANSILTATSNNASATFASYDVSNNLTVTPQLVDTLVPLTVSSSSTIGNLIVNSTTPNLLSNGDKLLYEVNSNLTEVTINTVSQTSSFVFDSSWGQLDFCSANNVLFVFGKSNRKLAKSLDGGNTWVYLTTISGSGSANLQNIAYFNLKYYLSIMYDTSQGTINLYSSSDLINWVVVDSQTFSNAGSVGVATNGSILSVAYSHRGGSGGGSTIIIRASSDGINFTASTTLTGLNADTFIVDYVCNNSQFLLSAWSYGSKSVDGITWSANIATNSQPVSHLFYNNNIYFACVYGAPGGIKTSSNWSAWTQPLSLGTLSSCTLVTAGGNYIALKYGTNNYYSSNDSITWNTFTLTGAAFNGSATYTGNNGYIGNSGNQLMWQSNATGTAWTSTDLNTILTYSNTITSPSLPIAIPTVLYKGGQTFGYTANGNYSVINPVSYSRSTNTITKIYNSLSLPTSIQFKASNYNNTDVINSLSLNITNSASTGFIIDNISFPILNNASISNNTITANKAFANATSWDYVVSNSIMDVTPNLLMKLPPMTISSSSTIGNLIIQNNNGNAINVGDKLIYNNSGVVGEITITALTSTSVFDSSWGQLDFNSCNGILFAFGESSRKLAKSLDNGNTWSYLATISGSGSAMCTGITFFNNKYYIALSYTTNQGTINLYSSSDLTNWNVADSQTFTNAGSVGVATNGSVLLVAYSYYNIAANGVGVIVRKTTDGIIFTVLTTLNSITSQYTTVVSFLYEQNRFLISCNSFGAYSIDGASFTLKDSSGSSGFSVLRYYNGVYVCNTYSATSGIKTSTDFITWNTSLNIGNSVGSSLCMNSNNIFVLCQSGTSTFYTSTNGTTWSAAQTATGANFVAYACSYNNQIFTGKISTQEMWRSNSAITAWTSTNLTSVLSAYNYIITAPSLPVAIPTAVYKGNQELYVSTSSTDDFKLLTNYNYTINNGIITKSYNQNPTNLGNHLKFKINNLNQGDVITGLNTTYNYTLGNPAPVFNDSPIINYTRSNNLITATCNKNIINGNNIQMQVSGLNTNDSVSYIAGSLDLLNNKIKTTGIQGSVTSRVYHNDSRIMSVQPKAVVTPIKFSVLGTSIIGSLKLTSTNTGMISTGSKLIYTPSAGVTDQITVGTVSANTVSNFPNTINTYTGYANGYWFAANNTSMLMYSSDKINWYNTNLLSNTANSAMFPNVSICYFVPTQKYYLTFGDGKIYTSSNILDWALIQTYTSATVSQIACSPTIMCFLYHTQTTGSNNGGSGSGAIYSSTDGITWTQRNTYGNARYMQCCLSYQNNKFVFSYGGSPYLQMSASNGYSNDGITWNFFTGVPGVVSCTGTQVIYDGTYFWSYGSDNVADNFAVWYSTTGASWTKALSGTNDYKNMQLLPNNTVMVIQRSSSTYYINVTPSSNTPITTPSSFNYGVNQSIYNAANWIGFAWANNANVLIGWNATNQLYSINTFSAAIGTTTYTITAPSLPVAVPSATYLGGYILSASVTETNTPPVYTDCTSYTFSNTNDNITITGNTIVAEGNDSQVKISNMNYFSNSLFDTLLSLGEFVNVSSYSIIATSNAGSATVLSYTTPSVIVDAKLTAKITLPNNYTVNSSSTLGNLILSSNTANLLSNGDQLIYNNGSGYSQTTGITVTSNSVNNFTSYQTITSIAQQVRSFKFNNNDYIFTILNNNTITIYQVLSTGNTVFASFVTSPASIIITSVHFTTINNTLYMFIISDSNVLTAYTFDGSIFNSVSSISVSASGMNRYVESFVYNGTQYVSVIGGIINTLSFTNNIFTLVNTSSAVSNTQTQLQLFYINNIPYLTFFYYTVNTVYIQTWNGTTWVEIQQITTSINQPWGVHVSRDMTNNTHLLVGNYLGNNVTDYIWNGTTFQLTNTINVGDMCCTVKTYKYSNSYYFVVYGFLNSNMYVYQYVNNVWTYLCTFTAKCNLVPYEFVVNDTPIVTAALDSSAGVKSFIYQANVYTIASPTLSVAVPSEVYKGGQLLQLAVYDSTPTFNTLATTSITKDINNVFTLSSNTNIINVPAINAQMKISNMNKDDVVYDLQANLSAGIPKTLYTITSTTPALSDVPVWVARNSIILESSTSDTNTPIFINEQLSLSRIDNLITGTANNRSASGTIVSLRVSGFGTNDKVSKLAALITGYDKITYIFTASTPFGTVVEYDITPDVIPAAVPSKLFKGNQILSTSVTTDNNAHYINNSEIDYTLNTDLITMTARTLDNLSGNYTSSKLSNLNTADTITEFKSVINDSDSRSNWWLNYGTQVINQNMQLVPTNKPMIYTCNSRSDINVLLYSDNFNYSNRTTDDFYTIWFYNTSDFNVTLKAVSINNGTSYILGSNQSVKVLVKVNKYNAVSYLTFDNNNYTLTTRYICTYPVLPEYTKYTIKPVDFTLQSNKITGIVDTSIKIPNERDILVYGLIANTAVKYFINNIPVTLCEGFAIPNGTILNINSNGTYYNLTLM